MNRDTSIQIKGIAILMMVWAHCFHTGWFADLYKDISFMGDNLSSILTRLTRPVEFFIILSGYGLFCLFQKKNKIDILPRCLKLYSLYLLCFAIFIPIACLIKPETYPGTLITFIENISMWKTSYNSTWWFLLPYFIILSLSNYIFKLYKDYSMLSICASAILYFIGYCLSWLYAHAYFQIPYVLYQFNVVLMFLFPFILGSSIAKYDIVKRLRNWCCLKKNKFLFASVLFLIIVLRLSTSIDFILQIVYTIAIILSYSTLPQFYFKKKVLQLFGTHSTSIWFVHAFFNMYLFTNYVYAFKYPICIYVVCLCISLITGITIDKIHIKLWGYFSGNK